MVAPSVPTISTPTPTRESLTGRPRTRLHEGRNFTKASVDLVELEGRSLVVKDVMGRPWPVRRLLGPWQLDREARAYARLGCVPGVPRFLGRLDPQAIVLEYIPGRTLASIRPGDLPGSFFDGLDLLVQALHAAGVAHGDLHRHDVLEGPGGRPYLVDFSTCLVEGLGSGPLRQFLFDQMRRAYLRSVSRLRRRLAPLPGAPLPPQPLFYRIGTVLRGLIRGARRPRGAP